MLELTHWQTSMVNAGVTVPSVVGGPLATTQNVHCLVHIRCGVHELFLIATSGC
jgi:hypothetical protein